MEYRNNIIKELALFPDNVVYVIVNKRDRKVQVSIVKNAVSWIARQVNDAKIGMHKCGDIENLSISPLADVPYTDRNLLRLAHNEICKLYIENGFKVYGIETAASYKIQYKVTNSGVLLCIVTKRNKLIWSKIFDKMYKAKAYAKGKNFEQLIGNN